MSITDELRRFANGSDWVGCTVSVSERKLLTIADRIDAEHEAQLKDAFETRNSDENQENDGWIRLPKDADGELIHIGDMMENLREDFEPPFHHTFRVYGIQYREYNQECTLTEDGYPSIQYRASEVRHYHEPTVENVLDEFASAYDRIGGEDEEHQKYLDLIAEYAAKLQLRSDQ